MFYCKSCGYEFDRPQKIYESHGFASPPYEEICICPNCKSADIREKNITHCRCCGAKLMNGTTGYCSEACKIRGENLQNLERKKRKLLEESPLNEIVRMTTAYNRQNNTNYSYGQYVAFVIPRYKALKKKCTKKRKNT